MANPWWILGGLYALDRLNRSSRETQENARLLAELEKAVHGEQLEELPLSTVGGRDEPGGCLARLGCLVSLVFLGGLAVFLGWLIFG
jgi:hypothetical protein